MKLFDRNRLLLKELNERVHDIDLSVVKDLNYRENQSIDNKWHLIAKNIISAKKKNAPVVLMIGGHVIRSGVQKFIIDLMEKGYISGIATNGSGMIHDYELALIGATTESVSKYIAEGQFGLWKETGSINDIINAAYKQDVNIGMGKAVGRAIQNGSFVNKNISIFAAAFRLNIPITVHVGIGYDIIHEHPNCDGAATGALSYNDFLLFASIIENLENGVLMDFGSAVMAPEVFLKSLSMARNVAKQNGKSISHFTSLVCDLVDLPVDFNCEPDKKDPAYYFRPRKTILIRTVADGGEGYYIRGSHIETIPDLWHAINIESKKDE